MFEPSSFLHGALWQPFTYSFIHQGLVGRSSSCFRSGSWLGSLRIFIRRTGYSGCTVRLLWARQRRRWQCTPSAALSYGAGHDSALWLVPWIFRPADCHWRALWRYGVPSFLHDRIKARYMAALYALVSIALLFDRTPHVCLCGTGRSAGGASGFICLAPRPASRVLQRAMVRMRNRYYRWKRRRAARKFKVICARRGKLSGSTARGGRSTMTPMTRSAGIRLRSSGTESQPIFLGADTRICLKCLRELDFFSGTSFAGRGYGTRSCDSFRGGANVAEADEALAFRFLT